MSFKKHIAGKIWTALTGGKQKTTGTEVIKGFTSKFKNQKSKEVTESFIPPSSSTAVDDT